MIFRIIQADKLAALWGMNFHQENKQFYFVFH
jgi:hypothetical protein